MKGRVVALDKDTFLPAAFSKVQKIGIGLKGNETSNKAGFLHKKIDSRDSNKTGRIALVSLFSSVTPVSGPLLVGFLSRSSDALSGSSLRYTL